MWWMEAPALVDECGIMGVLVTFDIGFGIHCYFQFIPFFDIRFFFINKSAFIFRDPRHSTLNPRPFTLGPLHSNLDPLPKPKLHGRTSISQPHIKRQPPVKRPVIKVLNLKSA